MIADDKFSRLAHRAAEVTVDLLPEIASNDASPIHAHALKARALREMFSFDAVRLRIADGLLNEAERINATPDLLAWRSLLRMFMIVERTETDLATLREEAEENSQLALEGAGSNTLVLGLVGKVRVLLDDDVIGGGALSRDAIRLNPGNPVGLSGLATALMRDGRAAEAVALARKGRAIAQNSPYVHWWGLFCCLAEITTGEFAAALRSAEAVHARAPNFRAPMRHLYALYLKFGDLERAKLVAERLRSLEPDFSLRKIRASPDYPAGVLRSSPLIELSDYVL